jgi:hypothetical protein
MSQGSQYLFSDNLDDNMFSTRTRLETLWDAFYGIFNGHRKYQKPIKLKKIKLKIKKLIKHKNPNRDKKHQLNFLKDNSVQFRYYKIEIEIPKPVQIKKK